MNKRPFVLILSLMLVLTAYAQKTPPAVDKVIAVVGSSIVKQSELEKEYLQYVGSDMDVTANTRCNILEELMYQRLLLTQAKKDSLEVTEGQVDQEIERRMRYYLMQFGSEQKFMDFYGKSIEDFKSDIREDIKNLLLSQKMQSKITEGITVTPSEIKAYFNGIHPDSVPFINAEVEIAQIVKKPFVSQEAKMYAKEECARLRERALKGEDFAALAALYSDDQGSAQKGGFYDNIGRGQFMPEFEGVAFALKEKEISKVFETSFGYHFAQLMARRGDLIDVRHILKMPKTSSADLQKAKSFLDSIYQRVSNPKDSLSFSDAAGKLTDDEEGRGTGGKILNPQTGNSRFEMDELGQVDPTITFTINKMKVGEIAPPSPTRTRDNKEAYRILMLVSRSEPHKMNLKDDYQRIQAEALSGKQQRAVNAWIKKKLGGTYVRVADEYKNCKFEHGWMKP